MNFFQLHGSLHKIFQNLKLTNERNKLYFYSKVDSFLIIAFSVRIRLYSSFQIINLFLLNLLDISSSILWTYFQILFSVGIDLMIQKIFKLTIDFQSLDSVAKKNKIGFHISHFSWGRAYRGHEDKARRLVDRIIFIGEYLLILGLTVKFFMSKWNFFKVKFFWIWRPILMS